MVRKTILIVAAAVPLAGPAKAQTDYGFYRQQAQEACMMDVMNLCAAYVPDEGQITSCMAAKRSQLSAPCRKAFDVGLRQTRRRG